MTSTKSAKLGLFVGGVCSCLMAAYHFVLPWAWNWGKKLDSLPSAIRWGSYSINFFMSYLMLAGGRAHTHCLAPTSTPGGHPTAGSSGRWRASGWSIRCINFSSLCPFPFPIAFSHFASLSSGSQS